MKIYHFLSFLFAIVIFTNCSSFKKSFIKKGDKNSALHNAILDFSKTCRLYKKDSVFSIFAMGLINNKDLLVVDIGKNNKKLLLTKEIVVGVTGKFPSRYVEKNGKLFFWWDKDYALTEQTLKVFKKYNLLQDDMNGTVKVADFIIDDAQKAAHYYFCKENLAKYKRVVTNKGIGYYNVPNLNCTDSSKN